MEKLRDYLKDKRRVGLEKLFKTPKQREEINQSSPKTSFLYKTHKKQKSHLQQSAKLDLTTNKKVNKI